MQPSTSTCECASLHRHCFDRSFLALRSVRNAPEVNVQQPTHEPQESIEIDAVRIPLQTLKLVIELSRGVWRKLNRQGTNSALDHVARERQSIGCRSNGFAH